MNVAAIQSTSVGPIVFKGSTGILWEEGIRKTGQTGHETAGTEEDTGTPGTKKQSIEQGKTTFFIYCRINRYVIIYVTVQPFVY